MTTGHTEQLVSFVLAILAGGVLWGLGAVVLRAGIALAGLALGALIGWLTWLETGGSFPLWIILLVFALAVGLVGLLIYRLLLAGLLSGILASVGLVTVWSMLTFVPSTDQSSVEDRTTPAPLIDVGLLLVGSSERSGAETTPNGEGEARDVLPAAAQRAEAVRRALVARISNLWGQWQLLAPRTQLAVVGSILGGILLGLVLATFARKTSAVIVTAVVGSVLIISSASRLLAMTGAPMHQIMEAWVLLPTVALAVLTIVGVLVQMTLLRRRVVNQEPAAS
ncbi:MAG: hypothetical protein CMJ41_02615 [Phycisphaerae bacterium]|nr:hypothetical protein [Phycisphaerae bacterium]